MGIKIKMAAALCLHALLGGAAQAAVEAPAPQTPVLRAAQGKEWNGAVRVFLGIDDNVALVTETSSYSGKEASPYVGFVAHGTYWKLDKSGWKGGISGTLGRTVYTTGFEDLNEDAPKEYNITVFNPQLFAQRQVKVGNLSGTVNVSYDFRWESVEIDDLGATHHRFGAKGRLQPMALMVVNLRFSRTHHNAKVEFPRPELDQRDGVHQMLEIDGSYVVPAAKGRFVVVYRRTSNAADGRNFDYSGNDFTFRYESQLNRRMWLDLGVAKDLRSYKGFVSNFIQAPGRDSMDILKLNINMLWKVGPQAIVDFHIKTRSYEAQDPIFKGNRKIGGIGITYQLDKGR